MKFILNYSDGFTEELVSFEAQLFPHKAEVTFDCFIGYIRNKSIDVELELSTEELNCFKIDLSVFEDNYELEMTDLKSLSISFELNEHKFKKSFYGYSPSVIQKEKFGKNNLGKLDSIVDIIRNEIINYSSKLA